MAITDWPVSFARAMNWKRVADGGGAGGEDGVGMDP